MKSVSLEKRAETYLKCVSHISEQLRGHAGLEPGAVARTTEALRHELAAIRNLGSRLPQVANRDHAEHGASHDFSTLVDVAEITFDTILAHQGIARGRRYKSNEFATAFERSFKQRNHDLSLEYDALKATLDIRTRQLGCLLTAAGTMLLTPLELRTLLMSLLTEDLLEEQENLFACIHERPKLIAEVLRNLGLSGRVLAQHFAGTLQHTLSTRIEARCDRFQDLVESLGLDDHEFTKSWIRIKRSSFNGRVQPIKRYRDDGKGGWEEQLEGDYPHSGWTAWIPLSQQKSTTSNRVDPT